MLWKSVRIYFIIDALKLLVNSGKFSTKSVSCNIRLLTASTCIFKPHSSKARYWGHVHLMYTMKVRSGQIKVIYFTLCKDLLLDVICSRFFEAKEINISNGQKLNRLYSYFVVGAASLPLLTCDWLQIWPKDRLRDLKRYSLR